MLSKPTGSGVSFNQFRSWRNSEPPLKELSEIAKEPVYQNRMMMAGLGLLGGILLATPISFNKLPKPIETALLAASVLNFSALGVLAQASVEGEKLRAIAKNVQKETLKHQLKNIAHLQVIQDDAALEDDTLKLIDRMPEHRRAYYLHKYQLLGLVPQPEQEEGEMPATKSRAIKVRPNESIEEQYAAQMMDEFINPSWATPDFIMGSKFIFAPKGSGKTCWLTYEAVKSVELNPGGVLWICDIHYDSDESNWLPGIPQDVLEDRYLFTTADAILNRFKMARQILRDRASKGLKKEAPVRLICDEFDGFMRRIQEGDRAEVVEIIQEIEDEGRKYKVFQTIVAHSGKKEQIGIDSTAIAQMHVMAMGNALADPNTRLPDDIDKKALLREQMGANGMIPELPGCPGQTIARAIVLRKLNESAQVVYVPHPAILLDGCTLELDDGFQSEPSEPVTKKSIQPTVGDPMLVLKEWYQECAAVGEVPSNTEIAAKLEEFTGRTWNQSQTAMQILREALQG